MDITIRRISNGYIVKLNGRETFHDVPEAICGETSAWVLEECRRLDSPAASDAAASKAQSMSQLAQAMSSMEPEKRSGIFERLSRSAGFGE